MKKFVLSKFILVIFLYLLSCIFYLKDVSILLNSKNVLTSFDGYYYALIAKELINNEYTPIDYLCNVPDFCFHSYPPPMHSFLAYLLNKIFNIDLKYSFVFFSPLLAPLMIFSMYMYTREFLPVHAFISGAVLATLNTIYFGRNIPGRFDTDSLILFFIFLCLFFILKVIEHIKELRKSLIWFTLFVIIFYLFMWWYTKYLFALAFLLSLIIGYFTFYIKNFSTFKYNLKNFSIILFLYVLSINIYFYYGFLDVIWKLINYFLKKPLAFIPESITKYIIELQPASLKTLVYSTTDNTLLFILCLIGFFIILYKHFKYISVAIPIMLIGFLSFKSGVRFLMYLIPFLGLGVGYSIYIIYSFFKDKYFSFLNKSIYKIALYFLIILISFPTSLATIKPTKVISDKEYDTLERAKPLLSKNSYIWSQWSYGNIFEYILEKGTYTDNRSFPIIKIYSIANSLYTNSYERSYKLISFITNNYFYQYNEMSFKDFNKKINKYNKPPKNDIYLIFYKNLPFEVSTTRIGVYGTKIKNFEIPMVKNISKCEKLEKNRWNCGDFIFDDKNYIIIWSSDLNTSQKKINIVGTYFIDRNKNILKELGFKLYNLSSKNLILEIEKIENKLYFSYITETFFDTVFNKLYFLNSTTKYFQKIYDRFPYFVIYRVKEK